MNQDEKDIKEFEEWWLHTSFDFMPAITNALKQAWLEGRQTLREKLKADPIDCPSWF